MNNLLNVIRALFFGTALGFVMSIPLGPSGIESVKRTISKGYREGFSVALGAIGADLAYLLIINAGLSNLLSKNPKTEDLFWVISGIFLTFISYSSIKSHHEELTLPKFLNPNSKSKSVPYLTGFIITFSNPMTPSLWLTLSGTVIRSWYYISKLAYYTFIFSIILGMVAWFALLNYLAIKGFKILKPKASNKASRLLMWVTFIIGIAFMVFGIVRLIIIL